MQRFKMWAMVLGNLFLLSRIYAQADMKISLAPSSPEAAMLFRFQDIPVGKYTGTADINIPLVNVQDKMFSWPVSLSYHTSGNKVSDIASFTGLGWSLNASGMISRKVRGIPDDHSGGRANTLDWYSSVYSAASNEGTSTNWQVLLGLMNNLVDEGPDEFYFSFNGISGKIAFGDDNLLKVSCNVPVTVNYSGNQNSSLGSWSITTPNGFIYRFSEVEKTRTEVFPVNSSACGWMLPRSEYISSWFLSSISRVDDNANVINFLYDDYSTDYEWIKTVSESHSGFAGSSCSFPIPNPNPRIGDSKSRTFIKGKKIRKIVFGDSKTNIDFVYTRPRQDLPSTVNDMSLDSVIVSVLNDSVNTGATLIQKVALDYFYQGNRLMLRSVQQIGTDNDSSVPPYQFAYNPVTLPDRIAGREQIDHWGYFNNGTKLLPAFNELNIPGWYYYKQPGGSDREPDLEKTKAQILEKIIYPTGGITKFSYEQNVYGFLQDGPVLEQGLFYMRDTAHSIGVNGDGYPAPGSPKKDSVLFTIPEEVLAAFGYEALLAPCYSGDGGQQVCPQNSFFPKVKLYKYEEQFSTFVLLREFSVTPENLNVIENLTLPPAVYKIVVSASKRLGPTNLADAVSARVSYLAKTAVPVREKTTGGLRIRQVSEIDPVGGLEKVRQFDYSISFGGNTISSGTVYGEPKYKYDYFTVNYARTGNGDQFAEVICPSVNIVGSTQNILSQTAGSHIGYQQVTDWEIYKGQPNGKVVTHYTSPFDYPDKLSTEKPFGEPESRAYKTGLVVNETVYDREGNLQKTDSFEYYFNEKLCSEIKVSKGIVECPCPNPNQSWASICREGSFIDQDFDGRNDLFAISRNKLVLGFPQLKREKHVQDGFAIEKNYEYDTTFPLVKRIVVKNNPNEPDSLEISYKYPGDEGSMPGLSGDEIHAIEKMKELGMISNVLEETKKRSGIETITIRNHFKDFNQPWNPNFQKLLTSGISIRHAGGALERKYTIEKYNAFGQITQQRKENDFPYAFIWDYKNGYPTAEISNATADKVAYTSFEYGGENLNLSSNGWIIGQTGYFSKVGGAAVTGAFCYDLSGGAITRTNLPSGSRYIISYWSKNGPYNVNSIPARQGRTNGGGWTYYEHISNTATTSITVSGGGLIDELRLYPEGAQMNTYCYSLAGGLSSKNTQDNIITQYEYDSHSRLQLIRDQDGNILEMVEYRYLQQERSSVANWVAVTPLEKRCETGADLGSNNQYNTGYSLIKETDNNPFSLSYQQSRWVRAGVDTNCLVQADWQVVGTECTRDNCGNNTGTYRNRLQDKNPYSPTYNQIQLSGIIGMNPGVCPVAASCSGGSRYRLINNACELGQIVVTSTVTEGCITTETYHYHWSCGPDSPDYTRTSRIPGCVEQ